MTISFQVKKRYIRIELLRSPVGSITTELGFEFLVHKKDQFFKKRD